MHIPGVPDDASGPSSASDTLTSRDAGPAPLDPRREAALAMKVVGQIICVGALIAVVAVTTHSTLPAVVLGALVALAVGASFPSAGAVRWAAAALALAPDTITVFHISGSPVALRTVAFGFVGLVSIATALRGRLRLRVPTPFFYWVMVLAACIGAFGNGRARSLLEFVLVIALPPVTGAIIGSDRQVTANFLRGLTAGTILVALFAIFEGLRNKDYLISAADAVNFVRAGHVRTTAGWDFPTTLSAFLCLAGFFLIHAFHKRWSLPGMVVGGTIVIAALITTQARSGLLGFAAGALVYLLLQRRASQGLVVALGLGTMIGLVALLPGAAPHSFREFVSESLTPGSAANSNVHYRQELYSRAQAAISHQPWFGYGYGSGKSVATNQLHQYFGDLTDLASLPVSLAVQVGLVGTGALFLILIIVVVRLGRARSTPDRLPLAAGIVACFVAMLGVPVTAPLSWMLLLAGIGWSLTQRATGQDGPPIAADASTDVPAQAPALQPRPRLGGAGGVRRE